MSTAVMELNDSNFKAAIADNRVLLVEFYTSWCGLCVKACENLVLFAKKTGCKVGKCNIQDNPKTLWRYAPNGIPFYMLFMNGKPVKGVRGIVNLSDEFEPLIPAI